MGFIEAISSCFQKYADFSGRSRRSEFWYWTLFTTFGYVAALIVDALTTGFLLYLLFVLATFLPSLAVSVRRLHDIDRTGWWLLIALIPIIGAIVLLVWYVAEGTAGENRFDGGPVAGGTHFCPQCGAENHRESTNCTSCGESLSAAPEALEFEAREATSARFLTPLVGLIVGLA